MDQKTKERLNQVYYAYRNIEKQIGTRYNKLPQRYFWLFGAVSAIIFTVGFLVPNSPVFNAYSDIDKIVIITIGSALFSVLFTGFASFIAGLIIIFVILTPIIQNKVKDAKTIFIDYPKLLRDGTFNENTEKVIKQYLRIVFKEELDIVRKNLEIEIREEIKKTVNPANVGFQEHQQIIKKLQSDLQNALSSIAESKEKISELEKEIKKLKGDKDPEL